MNQYRVILEVKAEFKQSPENLKNIYLRPDNLHGNDRDDDLDRSAHTGPDARGFQDRTATRSSAAPSADNLDHPPPPAGQVPLSAITRFSISTGPLVISHLGQFPATTISFNLAPGASLGKAADAIDATAAKLGMPASIQTSFQGTAQAFRAALANEPILILAALITVYIVLGVLYESYIHPITILSTLPSAGIGAIVALLLFHTEFSVIALIGLILLIGIVKKNGIMIVDFALEAERKEGKEPVEAIYQASLLRFRPIMMTTMAALLGALPLAMGTRAGFRAAAAHGYFHSGRPHHQPGPHPLHHSRVYLWFDRLAGRLGGIRSKGRW